MEQKKIVEKYLQKNIFDKYERLSFILYKYKEVKKFLELCEKHNIFLSPENMTWGLSKPFFKNFFTVCNSYDYMDKFNPVKSSFEGNLVISGNLRRNNEKNFCGNKLSDELSLEWYYTSEFFEVTDRRINSSEYEFFNNSSLIITLNDFKDIIKEAYNWFNFRNKSNYKKIENLKI